MFRNTKLKKEFQKVNPFTFTDNFYEIRKQISAAEYIDPNSQNLLEPQTIWIQNRFREKDPCNNYESMQ